MGATTLATVSLNENLMRSNQIAEAELVAQIPAHTQDDHIAIEVPPRNNSSTLFRSFAVGLQFSKDHGNQLARGVCTRADSMWPSDGGRIPFKTTSFAGKASAADTVEDKK